MDVIGFILCNLSRLVPWHVLYLHRLITLFAFFHQIQEFIVEKIVAVQVNTIPDLLQTSSVIGSAIQDTETVSAKSLVSTYK